jgi:hypothetical protein
MMGLLQVADVLELRSRGPPYGLRRCTQVAAGRSALCDQSYLIARIGKWGWPEWRVPDVLCCHALPRRYGHKGKLACALSELGSARWGYEAPPA